MFIIENLSNKNFDNIRKYIKKLDITINEDGDILKSDVERLLVPTKYNIVELHNKINEANLLANYLNKKITRSQFSERGISEEEMYPYFELQFPRYEMYDITDRGYVPFTDNQIKEQLKSTSCEAFKLIKKL